MGLKSISNYFKDLIKEPNLEQNINLEKEAKLIADKHRLTKYMELSDNKNNNVVFSGKKNIKEYYSIIDSFYYQFRYCL
nr:hypothetical protein [Rickettsia sp. TH2014]